MKQVIKPGQLESEREKMRAELKLIRASRAERGKRRKSGAKADKSKRKGGDFYLTAAWRQLRYLALRNCEGRCQCCGGGACDGLRLHVDHVKPRSQFPELAMDIGNLQVLCEDCNLGKGGWDSTDWRAHMKSI